MIPDGEITLPSCSHCHDWLFPSVLWAYPVRYAVVWVCLNCCTTLVLGTSEERPEREDIAVLAGLGVWVAAQRAEA